MPDVPISSSGPDAIVRDFAEGSAAHLKPVFESDLPRWSPKPRLTKQYVIDREIVLLGYSEWIFFSLSVWWLFRRQLLLKISS